MDILIIAEFCGDFSTHDNGRFLYLAKALSGKHDVEIVTSAFYHGAKDFRRQTAAEWPFRVTFLEEPGYPKNICLKRFYSHYRWGRNVLAYLESRRKPDVVYCAVPSLTGPNLVARYCEKNRIRFVIDVQDLWPEAFRMVANIPLVSDIVFAPFTALANGIYKRADAVCAVSETYSQRALRVNRKCKKGTVVFLGTELATFDRCAAENPVLVKKRGEIWLAYCGTLGASYDLICVIDALALLKDDRLKFVVMGDGSERVRFEAYAEEQGVNAVFTGRLPYNEMCRLLAECDIALNPISRGAAQSIINKHADYAACGLPVINTQENAEYRNLVDQYRMGINCKNGNVADVAASIVKLANNEELRKRMGENARRCAEERFDRALTYSNLKKTTSAGGGKYSSSR